VVKPASIIITYWNRFQTKMNITVRIANSQGYFFIFLSIWLDVSFAGSSLCFFCK
jgi:hypothetical protein